MGGRREGEKKEGEVGGRGGGRKEGKEGGREESVKRKEGGRRREEGRREVGRREVEKEGRKWIERQGMQDSMNCIEKEVERNGEIPERGGRQESHCYVLLRLFVLHPYSPFPDATILTTGIASTISLLTFS